MRCIFCKADTATSRSAEHIIPESLGNDQHILPIGVVCDGCNNYFARKVEHPVLDSEMFRLIRGDMQIPNKRGIIPDMAVGETHLPDYRLIGRFLGKVGLEVLASRLLAVPGWNNELVDHASLEPLRRYVRFNEGTYPWPFAFRTLYPVNAVFSEDHVSFELLHEYQLLRTDSAEIYIVLALFGVEFVLNLGGPELDGWHRWLSEHNDASPLYPQATK